jgi:hypothetical protein
VNSGDEPAPLSPSLGKGQGRGLCIDECVGGGRFDSAIHKEGASVLASTVKLEEEWR